MADDPQFAPQLDKTKWPELKVRLTQIFSEKSRDEWCKLMEGTDVCFAPVLTMSEAAKHPHNVARETFIEIAGSTQPAPAPRFSRTATATPQPSAHAGANSREVLTQWGIKNIDDLLQRGIVKEITH